MQNPITLWKACSLDFRNRRNQKRLYNFKRYLLELNQIRTVGIVATCAEALAELTYEFEKRGKKVSVLLIETDSKTRSYPERFSFDEVSWKGEVVSDVAKEFVKYPFDCLLCLNEQSYSPLEEYILLNTPARCRVGRFEEGKERLCELLISTNENASQLGKHILGFFLRNQEAAQQQALEAQAY
jgi:hypothetical protein